MRDSDHSRQGIWQTFNRHRSKPGELKLPPVATFQLPLSETLYNVVCTIYYGFRLYPCILKGMTFDYPLKLAKEDLGLTVLTC
jgi:hypothetical protein